MPLDLLLTIERPFPGLRPFLFEDSLLFFGREQHTRELLRRLATDRFLAVIGGSGSGKSSLVRAGLLPALYSGQLAGATTHWRTATMRPGADPLENLCDALAEALGEDSTGDRSKLLRTTSLGLAEVVVNAGLAAGESLLIVVDQFEELFRFAVSDETEVTAAFFVSSLLAATDRYDVPVYVVLTMRSDFLGECARFNGLAEALSRCQFLIPRLTREERQQAIERPLQLAGVTPTPSLVQQLLNDSEEDAAAMGRTWTSAGARPDPLPILQHALMKTFERWRQHGGDGTLTLGHYNDVGGMDKAIDRHAEEIFRELNERHRAWAENIFQCVTTIDNGRQTRRPTRRGSLFRIVGAATAEQQTEVNAVVARFSCPDDSLLVISNQDRVDIPHESLLWRWKRLQGWVVAEAESARRYRDLVTAVIEHENGRAGFWRDPDLRTALDVAARDAWNADWAEQYRPIEKPSFADVQEFLAESQVQQTKDRWLWRAALLLVTVGILASLYYWRETRNERVARGLLESRIALERSSQMADERARDATRHREAFQDTLSPGKLTAEQRAEFDEALRRENEARQAADSLRRDKEELTASGSDLAALNEQLQASLSRLEGDLQRRQESLSKLELEYAQALAQLGVVRKELDAKDAEIQRLTQEGERRPNTGALLAARQRVRPVEGGTSISLLNDWEREGTICCVVQDAKGKQYVLSHAWAMRTIGASLTQPATAKGATADDVIAKVTRFARLGSPPRIAVAIAELTSPIKGRQAIGDVLVGGIGEVRDGQTVRVVSPSGIISGSVESSRRTIQVPTLQGNENEVEAIIVNANVDRRDAGAPVLTADESRLVGLVLSGNGAGQVYVLPIASVLKMLDVELVP